MDERDPLKRFVVSGIMVIISLLVTGVVVTKAYFYNMVHVMIQLGFLENGVIPLIVADVARHAIVGVMVFLLMWMFFARLETTWLRLQEMIER